MTARAQRLLTPVAYLALFAVMALAAYWAMFSRFVDYDDEGYLDLTLRHFLQGHDLYGEISTQYGPFYYLLFGGAYKIMGVAVTTNSGRLIQVAVWLAASLLVAVAAHRRTRSLLLGLATAALTFRVLEVLTSEPMHPGALLVLLVSATAFALLVVVPTAPRSGLALAGAIGAAAALVKINVGGFVLIALAMSAALALPGWPSRPAPRRVLVGIFVLLAPVLMAADLDATDTQNLAIVVAAGAGALAIAAGPVASPPSRDAAGWWTFIVLGAAGAAAIITLGALAVGTNLGDLIEGVLVQPTRQRTVLQVSAKVPDAAVLWSIVALAVAWAVRSGALRLGAAPGAALRAAAGLGLWFTATASGPLVLGPTTSLGLAPLLCWVAAVPPADRMPPPIERFVRLALPAVAVLQTLHAYPVAGSQVGFASVLFPLVGTICLADALQTLAASPRLPTVMRPARLVLGGLALWAMLMFAVRPAQTHRDAYRAGTAVPYVGATRLHLPSGQLETLRPVVDALRRGNCQTIVGMPTLGTITMWAGADTPVGLEPDGWTIQLDADRQARIVRRLRDAPQPVCGLRNDTINASWQQGRPVPQRPLARYVDRFRPSATFGDYRVLEPPPTG